jgi:tetratricopeptide (TPR) repeat protein
MEYVHGEPVDRYCDRAQLDVRARLNLFLEICSAVQYAHQNLIVHRDLKPANILVTAEGAPKLLDFGIAKLLDVGDSAAMLALTRMNDRLLTPEYASPEQILGRAVTTASDVYALGVVLYELLTGLRPYVVPASASQLELERSICVSDPQRPSAAVRRSAEGGPAENQSPMPAIAAARGLTPERLHKRLAGDIDSIIMRALRKEPQHRYGSVEQLTADIRRYLTREPVQARQGNWLYYSQRFMRRHAFGVSVSVTFIGVILAFAIVMSVQRERIAHERDRAKKESTSAEKVVDFMANMIMKADPMTNQGRQPMARDLLDNAAREIKSNLNEQPAVRARLLYTIGRAYRGMSLPDLAITFLQDAVSVGNQDPEFTAARRGEVHHELGVAFRDTGKFTEADKEFRQALATLTTPEDLKSKEHAQLLVDMGRLELLLGNLPVAEEYLTRGLELARESGGQRTAEVGTILTDLAAVYSWKDDLVAAEKVAREAKSIFANTMEPKYPDRVMADSRLAQVLSLTGKTAEAKKLYEEVLTAQRDIYGPASRQVADTLDSLARVHLAQNDLTGAEELAREAVSIVSAHPEGFLIGYLRTSLAQILLRQEKYAEAETQVREAMEVYNATLESGHMYNASAEYVLGEILLGTGDLVGAEAMLTASMNRYKHADSSVWRSGRSASALGWTLYRERKYAEAEKYLVQGFKDLNASNGLSNGADAQTIRKAEERITRFYVDRGERYKLEELQLALSRNDTAAQIARPN